MVLEGRWKAGRQMGGGKNTNEWMGLVCGAGRQMGATNESTGLVSGAGRSIDIDKGTNESLRLVRGAGRPMDVEKATNERSTWVGMA